MLLALEDTEIGATFQGCRLNNLRLADDIVLIKESPEVLQTLIDKMFEASSDHGLKINIEVISKRKQLISISINNNKLKPSGKLYVPGGTNAEDGTCGEDIKIRIRKAGCSFSETE